VKTLEVDDGSIQWDVQTAAVDGAIDLIKVDTGGSNYKYLTGVLASATVSTAVLPGTAIDVIGTYNGCSIFITSGLGAGQLRTITTYDNYIANITPNWTTTPDVTSNFVLGPTVNIVGNGSGATAYTDLVSGGAVQSVTIVSRGSGYSNTTVALTDPTGTNASLRAILPPTGGHGSNPVEELGGTNVMMSISLSGTEGGDFTANNDFRVVSLIKDPKYANGTIATTSTLTNLQVLNLTSLVGAFVADETITGSTSGATASIVDVLNSSTTIRTVPANTKSFQAGEIITGSSSGTTAVINTITASELTQRSGKVLFVDNRVAIQRSADQIENIRYTISF
jgi:hypothetical protein